MTNTVVQIPGCASGTDQAHPAKTLQLDGIPPLKMPYAGPAGKTPSAAGVLVSDAAGQFTAQAPQGWQPSDAGYLAWTFDPSATSSVKLVGSGNLVLARIPVRAAITVTSVVAAITVAGSVLTAAENFAGLFDSTGALLAATADQSAVWTTAGVYPMALAGGPVTLQPGYYWAGILANGTTAPTFLTGSTLTLAANNAGFTAATARGAFNGSGKTALASFTPASNTFYSTLWAALS